MWGPDPRRGQGLAGGCCSLWGTVQPSPSPRVSWVQAGLGTALPEHWEVLAWTSWEPTRSLSTSVGAQTPDLPPRVGRGSLVSINSEKILRARVRRLTPGQTLPVERTLTPGSCCCAVVLGRTRGHPFLPAPGARLAPSRRLAILPQHPPVRWDSASPAHPCQALQVSWPARLGRKASVQQDQPRCSPGSDASSEPPCLWGETLSDASSGGVARGRCLHRRQGVQAAGHRAAGSAKAGQVKQSKILEKSFAQRLPPKG